MEQFVTIHAESAEQLHEIIIQRNNLAHCESIKDADGNELLKTRNGDVVFTSETFKTIRLNIRKYRDLFQKLRMFLNKQF